jgi:hypothetical protein
MINSFPTEYALDQVVPDSVNPSATTVRYDLPNRSWVVIEVYNAVGQTVATLVSGEQDAGNRTAVWNASGGVGSGVYFYRMTATSVDNPGKTFVQIRKMLLVR